MPAIYVYLAIAVYVIIGTYLAWRARQGLKSGLLEYFLAGRKTGGIVAALSYSATTYSAFMMVGLAGYTYSGGIGALGFELVYLSGLALVAFFGPRFWLIGKKYNFISPYEMLGDRYQNSWIPVLLAATACIFLIPYLAVQLMGVGYLMNGLSGGAIPFMTGVIIAAILAIAWALIAGMRSVTWTDSLQSIIMIIVSVFILGFVVYQEFNGFLSFFQTLESDYSQYLSVPGPGLFKIQGFIGLTLPWFFFSISNPQVSQRLFIPDSLKSLKIMVRGFLVFGFIYTLVSVFWGFAALVLLPGLKAADMATPTLLGSQYVPTLLGLIAMIGITAAAISTIDSIMLTLSSVVIQDIFGSVQDQSSRIRKGKILIIIIALVGIVFASQQLDLIATLSVASSVGLLVVVPSIFGAFFWKQATAAGSLSSIVSGTLIAIYLQFSGTKPLGLWPGVWTLIISSLLFVGVSLVTTPPKDRAREYFDYLERKLDSKNII